MNCVKKLVCYIIETAIVYTMLKYIPKESLMITDVYMLTLAIVSLTAIIVGVCTTTDIEKFTSPCPGVDFSLKPFKMDGKTCSLLCTKDNKCNITCEKEEKGKNEENNQGNTDDTDNVGDTNDIGNTDDSNTDSDDEKKSPNKENSEYKKCKAKCKKKNIENKNKVKNGYNNDEDIKCFKRVKGKNGERDGYNLIIPNNYKTEKSDYGYNYIRPEKWYPEPVRPQKCVTENSCPVCPITADAVVGLKEWDKSRKLMGPSNINTKYIKNKLNKR